MYKVTVLGLSIKGNKVAKAHELVSSEQLAAKPEDLIKQGAIIKATNEEIKAWKDARAGGEGGESDKDDLDLSKDPFKMKTAELEAKAKELKIDISKASNNKERAALVQAEMDALAERTELIKEATDLGVVVADDKSNDQLKEEIAEAKAKLENK